MQKYNDNSPSFKDWSKRKLQSEIKHLEHLIYHIDCFGSKDILLLHNMKWEKIKRKPVQDMPL